MMLVIRCWEKGRERGEELNSFMNHNSHICIVISYHIKCSLFQNKCTLELTMQLLFITLVMNIFV